MLTFETESTEVSKILVNLVIYKGWTAQMDGLPFENFDDPDKGPQKLYKPNYCHLKTSKSVSEITVERTWVF